nr:hypothetical protein GCM10020093_066640 [Planobispora longispora]
MVVLPCGAGKTIVGAAAMAHARATTLILVTNTVSAHQWKQELLRRTSLTEDEIGEYTGTKKEIRPVTIATYQVMTTRRQGVYRHLELFDARDWGLIIYDEVHLLPAPIFRMTADLQARRRVGLTATLVREDGREGDVFSLIGPKRYDAPWKEMENQGWIAPADCVEVRVTLSDEERLAYAMAEAEERYRFCATTPSKTRVTEALVRRHPDEQVLIIGQYIDQLDELGEHLDAPVIKGRPRSRSASGCSRPSATRRSGSWSSRRSPTSPSICRRRRWPSRCRAPSGHGRRRPSGSAGCCAPSPAGAGPGSTPWSAGTPWTRSSPPTGSGSWPSRDTPTRSSTPTTCSPETDPSCGRRVDAEDVFVTDTEDVFAMDADDVLAADGSRLANTSSPGRHLSQIHEIPRVFDKETTPRWVAMTSGGIPYDLRNSPGLPAFFALP